MMPPTPGTAAEEPACDLEDPFREEQQQQRQQQQPFSSNSDALSNPSMDVTPLAKFAQEEPTVSGGVVRRIVYFPIVTTIVSTDSSKFPDPAIPIGPHLRSMNIGVSRNRWVQSSVAGMERRYSELVDLRTLLAFQFPTLIVPPLPPKSNLENFGTLLKNEGVIITQQHSIARFLREIAIIPELMYFSVFTPNFFQLPRESFEDWVGSMRATLEEFRHLNTAIDGRSTRRSGLLGSESVTTITDSSTKVVRKLVGILQSWMGGSDEVQRQQQKHSPQRQRQQQQQQQPVQGKDYVNTATTHVSYWTNEVDFLSRCRTAITETLQPYLTFMQQSLEAVAAQKDVAESLEKYAEALAASTDNKELAQLTLEASRFMDSGVLAVDSQQRHNKREVYERLLFEVAYIDAALDAIDHVLCLWSHCSDLVGDPGHVPLFNYTVEVSKRLREYYETRFLRVFRHRMLNMIQRMVRTGKGYAEKAVTAMQSAAFSTTIKNPTYTSYE
ncbi:hypothetical protein DQ04_10721010 [Trypanosoma grayi]|uniref:hypothetical protein n=1 Tax=Trypanosoma grayi TaxID=71804 RepID=UPI0004F45FA0|nr:hypothetical protein DQ04_10721010 [Trypanosoma grayi]KEG07156.1 hypothetical protein DQ04_10721010 [Trypanosoma grayi]